MTNELALKEPPVAQMLQAMIDKGVTQENVAALQSLVELHERIQKRDAERQFTQAFAKLQSELPQIQAIKPVPNKDGTVRYRFAPYEELMEKLQPFLTANGFAISFNSRFDNGRMIAVCELGHISGHSKSNEFAVRIGQGPPGATETQSDGAAKTYAKRGALCDALNIVVSHDDDARIIGAMIDPSKAAELRQRVRELGRDEAMFLKLAGVAPDDPVHYQNYEEIPASKLEILEDALARAEARK